MFRAAVSASVGPPEERLASREEFDFQPAALFSRSDSVGTYHRGEVPIRSVAQLSRTIESDASYYSRQADDAIGHGGFGFVHEPNFRGKPACVRIVDRVFE